MRNNRFSFLRRREIPRGVWALGMVSLFTDLSSEMVHALLPLYLVGAFGASILTVGVIEGIAEATSLIVKIFSGTLSDYLGNRKWLTAGGYGLSALTKPVIPLATSIGWLITARFVDRIGKGIRDAPRDALVADLTPAELRGASYGLRQSLDTIGAVLGPLAAMAFMLLTANHFKTVFWIAVAPAFLSFAIIALGVREPKRAVRTKAITAPSVRADLMRLGATYWGTVGVAALFTLARFSEAFLLLRAQSIGIPVALVPATMVVMNIVYAVSAWPAGELSDRIGRRGVLTAGFVLLVLADLVLAFGASVPAIMLGVVLWGLHMGLTQGVLASLIADTSPEDLRGTAFGTFNLIAGAATLLASVIAGSLWVVIGPQGAFLGGAAFAAVALSALPLIWRKGSDAPAA